MPKGTMRLTRSLTSGLARCAADPADVFWGVGDRGPNIKPKAAVGRYGLDALKDAAALDGAKVMPLPQEGRASPGSGSSAMRWCSKRFSRCTRRTARG